MEALNHSRDGVLGTIERREVEGNNFDLTAVFVAALAVEGKKGINYMAVKVHTRWNGAFFWLYLTSPVEP